MRVFIILCALLAFKTSISQQIYNFKEVGWTLVLPADFEPLDSAENAARNESGKKAIEQSTDSKADISQTRTLISAKKDTYNYFNATITAYNPAKDGNFDATTQSVKDVIYKTFSDKMPDGKIDSSSDNVSIDGLAFDRFHITVTMEEKVLFNMFLLSKLYKEYDFTITYLYLNEETKKQIDTILSGSKFSK